MMIFSIFFHGKRAKIIRQTNKCCYSLRITWKRNNEFSQPSRYKFLIIVSSKNLQKTQKLYSHFRQNSKLELSAFRLPFYLCFFTNPHFRIGILYDSNLKSSDPHPILFYYHSSSTLSLPAGNLPSYELHRLHQMMNLNPFF